MLLEARQRAALAEAGRALLAGDLELYDFCRAVWEIHDPISEDPRCPPWLTEVAERCERCDVQFDAATLDGVYAAARAMVRHCESTGS